MRCEMITTFKISARKTANRSIRFRHAILRLGAWTLLLLGGLLTALLIGWILLGVALLGSGPSAGGVPVPVILLALLVLTGLLAWLTARFIASWRRVGQVIGLIVVLVTLVGVTWAVSAPNEALYFARQIAWGGNNAPDYASAFARVTTYAHYDQRFPLRAIDNAAPAFRFPEDPSPQLFKTILYQQGGKLKQTSLDEFLHATQTTSLIVIKEGRILDESYASGFSRDSIVTSFSIAKSFISALIGIAIHEGYIGGVDDRMVAYLPELRGKGLDNVTLRDLLTQSSGISTNIENHQPAIMRLFGINDNAITTNFPDLRSQALSVRAGSDTPGMAFNYSNYSPILLGLILERATHCPVAQYLQEKIWQPLGMEYPASWTLDSTQSGFEKMAMGINARAIDFAKFGQLYLNLGWWNGQQIIPEQWVNESTTPDPTDNRPWRTSAPWKESSGYYKYLWWGQIRPDGSYVYMARGNLQQQWIYISPSDHVVIVRFGLVDGSADSWPDIFNNLTAKFK